VLLLGEAPSDSGEMPSVPAHRRHLAADPPGWPTGPAPDSGPVEQGLVLWDPAQMITAL